MINRKEYSDLPAEQKIVYMKRMIIVGIVTFIPIVVVLAVSFSVMFNMIEQFEEFEKLQLANQTSIEQTEKVSEMNLQESIYVLAFLFVFLIVIFSVIGEGGRWGNDIADKLKLYTDFDLEYHEKEIEKIKGVKK